MVDLLRGYESPDEYTERAKKEKLCRLLMERQRRMAGKSLYYFVKYILGYRDLRLLPHWEMCRFIQENGYKHDTMTLCPRGTFKSTVVTIGWTLWMLTRNRDLRICIDSSKQGNAKNWLGVIQRHIETNVKFRKLYGDWKGEPWTTFQCTLAGRRKVQAEHSLVASSPETAKVSQHYDIYIMDDIQTRENVTSRDMIDKIEEHSRLVLPILDPQDDLRGHRGPRVFVGTRWHDDDIYGRLIARVKKGQEPGMKLYVKGASDRVELIDNRFMLTGSLYFPARFTQKYLDEIQGSMSMWEFSCNYLNDPLPEGTAIFSRKRLGWWNNLGMRHPSGAITPLPAVLNIFVTADPSLGQTADSDYSAFVVNGTDSEYNWLVQEVVREHLDPDAFVERMFGLHDKWHPHRFGMETVAFQKALLYPFREMCRQKGKYFMVEELATDTTVSKELRIAGLQPFVNSGKVFLRVEDDIPLTSPLDVLYHSVPAGMDQLLDELIRFPRATTKDCADALAYQMQLVFPVLSQGGPAKPQGTLAGLLEKLQTRQRSPLRAGIR